MKNISIVISVLISGLLVSCSVLKPTAYYVSEPDYNKRVVVSSPEYQTTKGVFGHILDFALPVAGAAGGALSGAVVTLGDNGLEPSVAGGAIFGALAGTGLTLLANTVTRYGQTRSIGSFNKWLSQTGGGGYIILEENGREYRLIDPDAEYAYTVYNWQDVEDFHKAFPSSGNASGIVLQSVKVLDRSQLPKLIQYYPDTDGILNAKRKYIATSSTYSQVLDAQSRYPGCYDHLELGAILLDKVGSVSDALSFLDNYHTDDEDVFLTLVVKAFDSSSNSQESIKKLYDIVGCAPFSAIIKEEYPEKRKRLGDAQYMLCSTYGKYLSKGDDGFKEWSKLLSASAENGNPEGLYTVAGLLAIAEGLSERVKDMYTEAANQGYIPAMTVLSDQEKTSGLSSIKWTEKLAETGDYDAMIKCAKHYSYGVSFVTEFQGKKAIEWYERGLQKDPGRFDNWHDLLAVCIKCGELSKADNYLDKLMSPQNQSSFKVFAKSYMKSPSDNPRCAVASYYADMFEGNAISNYKDMNLAAKYYRIAADLGDLEAGESLAKAYYYLKVGGKETWDNGMAYFVGIYPSSDYEYYFTAEAEKVVKYLRKPAENTTSKETLLIMGVTLIFLSDDYEGNKYLERFWNLIDDTGKYTFYANVSSRTKKEWAKLFYHGFYHFGKYDLAEIWDKRYNSL
ncbi:MAG: sel1 repeat family protein [Bacteroidales bacterium]|nr:sel1 repeat family protein [Bacteroidales bacterium]